MLQTNSHNAHFHPLHFNYLKNRYKFAKMHQKACSVKQGIQQKEIVKVEAICNQCDQMLE